MNNCRNFCIKLFLLFSVILCSAIAGEKEITFLAVGDLNLAGWLVPIINEKGGGYPFRHLKSVLNSGDIVCANLEAPFVEKGSPAEKAFVFKVPPAFVTSLQAGNINLVALANNHIVDYGVEGIRSTKNALQSAGIKYAGAGETLAEAYRPALIEINGNRIAFFSYSMTLPKTFFATDSTGGTAYPEIKIMTDSITIYAQRKWFVIVAFHWGKELQEIPDQYQVRMAHKVIDAGGSMVIGHHPHILQGVEVYRGKPVFYSLGNFIFASYSEHARRSMIVKAVITPEDLKSVELVPINVYNKEVVFSPRLLKGEERSNLLHHIQKISVELNHGIDVFNSNGYINLNKMERLE